MSILYGNVSIGLGYGFHFDGIADADLATMAFCCLGIDVESGAFVFLNTETGAAAVVVRHSESTRQAIGRNHEVAVVAAVLIGHHFTLVDCLAIGILECDGDFAVGYHLRVIAMLMIDDSRDVDGLTGTIDGTIGEE